MLAVRPRNIIHEIVRWPLEGGSSRNGAVLIVQPAEEDPVFIGVSDCARALSNETVPEVIDQRVAEHRVVTDDDTLAVVHEVV